MPAHKLTIPIAIVIAGGLVAGALFLTGNQDNPNVANDEEEIRDTETVAVLTPPVSSRDHILGNPEADVFIVEFSDTECPFCKNFHDTMHRVVDEHGKDGSVAWVYRHFPIAQLHSKAPLQAEATECAAELGGNTTFWSYIDRLFEITPSNNGLNDSQLPQIAERVGLDVDDFNRCLNSGRHTAVVEAQLKSATDSGARGTPHSILFSKEPVGADTVSFVNSAAVQLPPGSIGISEDRREITMTGALPYNFIDLILRTIRGEELPSGHGGL